MNVYRHEVVHSMELYFYAKFITSARLREQALFSCSSSSNFACVVATANKQKWKYKVERSTGYYYF